MLILILLSFSVSVLSFASCVQKDISRSVIRFHVKANSDTDFDQAIKLKVRNKAVSFLSPKLKDAKSVEESVFIIEKNIFELKNAVNEYLKENNLPYSATVYLDKKSFPTKSYENVTLPAGNYNALCIDLGKAEGENWWCVMFPPMCFTDNSVKLTQTSEQYLKQNLSKESYYIISSNEEQITTVYRFKIFDYLQNIKKFF